MDLRREWGDKSGWRTVEGCKWGRKRKIVEMAKIGKKGKETDRKV